MFYTQFVQSLYQAEPVVRTTIYTAFENINLLRKLKELKCTSMLLGNYNW